MTSTFVSEDLCGACFVLCWRLESQPVEPIHVQTASFSLCVEPSELVPLPAASRRLTDLVSVKCCREGRSCSFPVSSAKPNPSSSI